jgi:DNA-binding beta-propeller fold protein YncE
MLQSPERVVENLEPPAHAKGTWPAVSHPAELRNQFLTLIYGRPSIIHTARHVATDSQQRLVLSDPDGHAVHVLDPAGKQSIRLVAGKGYRLHYPEGVAVDARDNLYVADSDLGMVVVFDSSGNFLRYIGSYHGEPQYARPHGIAIDPQKQLLYLVDTPRNMVFKLDLDGNILKSVGRDRKDHGLGEFQSPTEIAVNHKYIYILDRWGTRVQVFDMSLKPVSSFSLPGTARDPGHPVENGLSADQDSRVYLSQFGSSLVGVYEPNGHLVSSFGQSGTLAGQFASPAGLWIDPKNRLYVADSGNGRVQVFQLRSGNGK